MRSVCSDYEIARSRSRPGLQFNGASLRKAFVRSCVLKQTTKQEAIGLSLCLTGVTAIAEIIPGLFRPTPELQLHLR